jgi:RNA:NAD 2'-phosphotransferase (TPT1/KptA family)
MLALPFTRGGGTCKPHFLVVAESARIEAVSIDDGGLSRVKHRLASVPAEMAQLDGQHVQYVLELNVSARFMKLRERLGAGYARCEQAAHDGHRRACTVRAGATKQPARVASKKFGIGEI